MPKQIEYIEGQEAATNFERLATAFLQAPFKKKKKRAKPASRKKPKPDKG